MTVRYHIDVGSEEELGVGWTYRLYPVVRREQNSIQSIDQSRNSYLHHTLVEKDVWDSGGGGDVPGPAITRIILGNVTAQNGPPTGATAAMIEPIRNATMEPRKM